MGRENAQLWLLLLFPPQKEPRFVWGEPGRGRSLLEVAAAGAELTPPVLRHLTELPTAQPGSPARQSWEVRGFYAGKALLRKQRL